MDEYRKFGLNDTNWNKTYKVGEEDKNIGGN